MIVKECVRKTIRIKEVYWNLGRKIIRIIEVYWNLGDATKVQITRTTLKILISEPPASIIFVKNRSLNKESNNLYYL